MCLPAWFYQELFAASATILVGIGIAKYGLTVYYKQKEYELVKQRYLEGAIDVIASEIELALGTFSHNWARSLNILKAYRDTPDTFNTAELKEGFLQLESLRFHRIAQHRIRMLSGSDVIWNTFQLAMAFAGTADATATKEIPETIRQKIEFNNIQSSPGEIVDVGFDELKKLDEESHKFAITLRTLQVMAVELEQQKLDFKAIASFHHRKSVQEALEELENSFKEELEPYQGENNP